MIIVFIVIASLNHCFSVLKSKTGGKKRLYFMNKNLYPNDVFIEILRNIRDL